MKYRKTVQGNSMVSLQKSKRRSKRVGEAGESEMQEQMNDKQKYQQYNMFSSQNTQEKKAKKKEHNRCMEEAECFSISCTNLTSSYLSLRAHNFC